MTNYEKYRDQLIEMMVNSYRIGVRDNKPIACDAIECRDCDLPNLGCSDARRAWLNAEAASTLTSDERKLCELLKTGYIAQDATEDGEIYYYPERQPSLDCATGCWDVVGAYAQLDNMFNVSFKGVHDIRTKAWRVEDLLTLEVCD